MLTLPFPPRRSSELAAGHAGFTGSGVSLARAGPTAERIRVYPNRTEAMATDRNWPISRTLLLCFSMMKLLNLGLHIVPLDRSAASAFDIAEAVPISGNGGISRFFTGVQE